MYIYLEVTHETLVVCIKGVKDALNRDIAIIRTKGVQQADILQVFRDTLDAMPDKHLIRACFNVARSPAPLQQETKISLPHLK